MKEMNRSIRFASTQKFPRKRVVRLSKKEKMQLVILALAMIAVLLVAMAVGLKTSHP